MNSAPSPDNRRQLVLCPVRGFCGGVRRALETVERLLATEQSGAVCVYHEIVHNNFVVKDLERRGVRFVHTLDEVPARACLVWSAHGVGPALEAEAARRGLRVIDATCPLVKKLHRLADEHSRHGDLVIFIGHAGHPETVGVLGHGAPFRVSSPADCARLPELRPGQAATVLSQTTLSSTEVENILTALRRRYPALQAISGICYATAERQEAVRQLAARGVELILVIGSPGSSNSNRLREVANDCGIPARLVDDPGELAGMDWSQLRRIGLTAGASAPEILVERAAAILRQHGFEIQS